MMKKVDKESPVPLYYQLKQILSDLIENEDLKPDDPVPTERRLCDFHGISRMTVNKAILTLVNEGLVYREQGRGTFVASPKEKHSLSSLLGFTEEMQRRGLSTNTKMIAFRRQPATKKLRQQLQLEATQEVFSIQRLRYIGGEPHALETAFIPVHLCPDLTPELLDNRSLYAVLLNRYFLEMDYANQTIEPVLLDDYESNILQVKKHSLALLFSRRTFLKSGIPFEVTKSVYRSDKYKFEVTLRS
ncbi:MAG TPA: GntR family transcriptional regulator [Patescibacteria group bacterium]|nr:GntR family transcriptional regulator [Patescibacteria group bacterium]